MPAISASVRALSYHTDGTRPETRDGVTEKNGGAHCNIDLVACQTGDQLARPTCHSIASQIMKRCDESKRTGTFHERERLALVGGLKLEQGGAEVLADCMDLMISTTLA